MPFWGTYYHLIWAIQRREPWIQPEPDTKTRLYGGRLRRGGQDSNLRPRFYVPATA